MSCYFRHLKELFTEAGITINTGNRKQIDMVVHEATGTSYKDCPATWKKLKEEILPDEHKRLALVNKLKKADS